MRTDAIPRGGGCQGPWHERPGTSAPGRVPREAEGCFVTLTPVETRELDGQIDALVDVAADTLVASGRFVPGLTVDPEGRARPRF